jgi:hypothetical protein
MSSRPPEEHAPGANDHAPSRAAPGGPDTDPVQPPACLLAECLAAALGLTALAPESRCAEHNRDAAEEDKKVQAESHARALLQHYVRLKAHPGQLDWSHLGPFQFVERVAAVLHSARPGPWRERWEAVRTQLAAAGQPDGTKRDDWFRQISERLNWSEAQSPQRADTGETAPPTPSWQKHIDASRQLQDQEREREARREQEARLREQYRDAWEAVRCHGEDRLYEPGRITFIPPPEVSEEAIARHRDWFLEAWVNNFIALGRELQRYGPDDLLPWLRKQVRGHVPDDAAEFTQSVLELARDGKEGLKVPGVVDNDRELEQPVADAGQLKPEGLVLFQGQRLPAVLCRRRLHQFHSGHRRRPFWVGVSHRRSRHGSRAAVGTSARKPRRRRDSF